MASIRREQIVEAAVGIIVHEGIHKLSLSRIEEQAGMSRGQLTYYFKTKEDILLAVFDRTLRIMCEQHGAAVPDAPSDAPPIWERLRWLFQTLLGPSPPNPEFPSLQYTFLAQMGHREDFRQRLASLYDHWRQSLAADWEKTPQRERPEAQGVSPRVLASFVQALLHGLTTQLAADPEAFDREEMLEFCFRMLAPFFAPAAPKARKRNGGHPSRPEGESHA